MDSNNKTGIILPSKGMQAQIGLFVLKLGLFIYARQYLKYNIWYLIPGLSFNWVKGYDYYIDFEVKFLCIGFGFRMIWRRIKNI